MLRRIIVTACVLAMATGIAWAKDATTTGKSAASSEKMKAMKASMMKCAVCKHMAAHWDEMAPMTTEVVKLNDGVVIVHSVSTPAKAATFHAAGKEMSTAGEACMTMTDEQAKTDLCEFCQATRSLMKSGAKMSNGETKLGSMMVLTSSDPAVQAQILALGDKCAMMAGSM